MDNTAIDLSSLSIKDDSFPLQIVHPVTGMPIEGMVIDILSADSPKVKAKTLAIRNKRLSMARRGKNSSAEDIETEEVDLLVAGTAGWKGIIFGGKVLEFNAANARMLYSDTGLAWLSAQVNEGMAQRANFIKT